VRDLLGKAYTYLRWASQQQGPISQSTWISLYLSNWWLIDISREHWEVLTSLWTWCWRTQKKSCRRRRKMILGWSLYEGTQLSWWSAWNTWVVQSTIPKHDDRSFAPFRVSSFSHLSPYLLFRKVTFCLSTPNSSSSSWSTKRQIFNGIACGLRTINQDTVCALEVSRYGQWFPNSSAQAPTQREIDHDLDMPTASVLDREIVRDAQTLGTS